jgi:hypothetical protein
MITRVTRIRVTKRLLKEFRPIKMSHKELREYLFNKRGDVLYPDAELVEHLRSVVRDELMEYAKNKQLKAPKKNTVVYFSPLSPVSNEVWAFWEYGRVLIHFSSDMPLSDEQLWEKGKMMVHLYDIDSQVVVTLNEVPGSNAYLTRDQAGRALYNCIILGRSYEIVQER